MQTRSGIQLNENEIKLIKSLKKLEAQWKKHGQDLWLYSASGSLKVMMRGSTKRNNEPEETKSGGANQNNIVATINIPNDGGDW